MVSIAKIIFLSKIIVSIEISASCQTYNIRMNHKKDSSENSIDNRKHPISNLSLFAHTN